MPATCFIALIWALKQVAGTLRLDLAAYRELEAFAQLGTELDKSTQRQLDRGARMVELLKQPQYVPMEVIDQVVQIFAGTRGFLDDIPLNRVQDFAARLVEHFRGPASSLREQLASKQAFSDELEESFKEAIREFKGAWKAGTGTTEEVSSADAEPEPEPAGATA